MRPVLLLDVDGVLNPHGDPCPPGYAEHALFGDDEEPVRVRPEHGGWIVELADAYDVVWATAWQHEADRLLAPLLGLPRFPHLTFPPPPFPPEDKVPVVAAHVGDRPAAWVDDLLTPAAYAWAAGRPAPTLLLPVDPAVGLTRATVDQALDWVSGGRGWASRSRGSGP